MVTQSDWQPLQRGRSPARSCPLALTFFFPNEVSPVEKYIKHEANTHPDQETELASTSRGPSCSPPNHCPSVHLKKETELTSHPADQFHCTDSIALRGLASVIMALVALVFLEGRDVVHHPSQDPGAALLP